VDVERSSIPYASLEEVQAGRGVELVHIEDDVLDVVRRLREIHPGLNVRWNPHQEYFTIYELCVDGRERIVTNVTELDPRLIEHFEMLASESWDAVAEMDRMDDQAERDKEYALAERTGEIGERLHHALRSDLEVKDHVYVPEKYRGVPR
jgi:hypothetical protein